MLSKFRYISQLLVVPVFLLALMWIFLPALHGGKHWIIYLIPLPFASFATVIIVSLIFNRPKITLVSAVFLALYGCQFLDGPTLLGLTRRAFSITLSLSIPLALIVMCIPSKRRFNEKRWVIDLPILFISLISVYLAATLAPDSMTTIKSWLPWPLTPFPSLPTAALLLWGIYLGLGFIIHERSRNRQHFLIGCSVVALFFALDRGQLRATSISALGFSSQSFILLYASLFSIWERIYLDDLTQTLNRRSLNDALNKLRGNYTLAMIDIDHFKSVNDTFGHEIGDEVLRYVATHLSTEHSDHVYRYGGEEFCLVFRNSSLKDNYLTMDKIRETLAEKRFHIRANKAKNSEQGSKVAGAPPDEIQITISAGMCIPVCPEQPPEQVLKLADQALYEAKNGGRNCVSVKDQVLGTFTGNLKLFT